MRCLDGIVHRLAHGDGTTQEQLAKSAAFEQFGYQVGRALMRAQLVDGKYVGMIQRSSGSGFLLETTQAVEIPGQERGEYLDRDVASQLRIARPVHFTHTTRPQWRQDFVRPEFVARMKAHFVRDIIALLRTRG